MEIKLFAKFPMEVRLEPKRDQKTNKKVGNENVDPEKVLAFKFEPVEYNFTWKDVGFIKLLQIGIIVGCFVFFGRWRRAKSVG